MTSYLAKFTNRLPGLLTRFLYLLVSFSISVSGVSPALRFAYAVAPSEVLINEFSSETTSDWVELYNPTSSVVSFTNVELTDDLGTSMGTLPASIEPLGLVVVEVSNRLNVGGDSINLVDVTDSLNPVVINSLTYPGTVDAPATGQIARRTVNGAGVWEVSANSTKGYTNDTSVFSVNVANTGSEFGTTEFPFNTIQEAIDLVSVGGTINVSAGTYDEAVTANKAVTIVGAGEDPTSGTILSTLLTNSGVLVTANDVTLQSLRINKLGAGRGIEVSGTISNLTLNSVTVTNALVGLRVGDASGIDGLTITNSHFDGNLAQGWYLSKSGANSSTVTNVSVTDTTFNDNLQKGLYAEKLENATFSNITVANSGTDSAYGFNAGIDINLKWSAYSNITIENSSITGSGLMGTASNPLFPAGLTIKARDDAPSYASPAASLTGVTLDNVTVSGGVVGVRFGEPAKSNLGPLNVNITEHNFSGTGGYALVNESQAVVNAVNNWWGSSDPAVVAAKVSGSVDFRPYYTDSGLTTLTPTTPGTPITVSTSPTNVIPTWTWNASIDADHYIFYWSTVAGGTTFNSGDITDVSYTPSTLDDGTWYTKVIAYDPEGTASAFSGNSNALEVDTVAPTFTAQRTGVNTIVLTFNEAVSASDTNAAAWGLSAGAVSSVTQPSNSTTLTLTTSGLTGTSETPTVTYVAANGTVADAANNEVANGAFAVASDAVAPTMNSAQTTSTTSINVTFSEDLNSGTVATTDFTVGSNTVSNISVTTNIVTLTLGTPIATGAVPAVQLVSAVNDTVGNALASAGPITPADGVRPTFTAQRTDVNTVVVTFSENVSSSAANENTAWTVSGGTVAATTQPANQSTLTITTSGISGTSETPTVAYVAANGTVVDAGVNEVTDGANAVASDVVAPVLTSVGIGSTNPLSSSYAKVGHDVTVNFTASESINVLGATIAGNNVAPAGSGTTWSATYNMSSSDTEGIVPFNITFADIPGNVGIAVSTTTNASSVTFDETPPVAPTNLTSPTPTNDVTPTFSWTAVVDSLSGLNNYFYRLMQGANTIVASTDIGNVLNATTTTLTQGVYDFFVSARDLAENTGPESSLQIVLDTESPVITNVGIGNSTTSNNTYVKNGDVAIVTATVTDNNQGTMTASMITADLSALGVGGTPNPSSYASNVATWNVSSVSGTGNGTVTVTVNAVDAASNNAVSQNDTITADNIAPAITVTYPPAGTTTSNSITLAATTSDTSGTAACAYVLDGGSSTAMDTTNGTSHSAALSMSSGSHNVVVACSDPALNSANTTVNWTSAVVTGGGMISETANIVFDSATAGEAELPAGVTGVVLNQDTLMDLSPALESLVAGNIVVNGVSTPITSIPVIIPGSAPQNVNLNNTMTIGTDQVTVAKAVQLSSGVVGQPVTLANVNFTHTLVFIPDETVVMGPSNWTGTMSPPRTITPEGNRPAGFDHIGRAIEVGSTDATLLFNKAVSIVMFNYVGEVAFKSRGSNQWFQIANVCGGTYDTPVAPAFPNECYTTNGTDTKILTYHFTSFAGISRFAIIPEAQAAAPASSTPASSSTASTSTPAGPTSSTSTQSTGTQSGSETSGTLLAQSTTGTTTSTETEESPTPSVETEGSIAPTGETETSTPVEGLSDSEEIDNGLFGDMNNWYVIIAAVLLGLATYYIVAARRKT